MSFLLQFHTFLPWIAPHMKARLKSILLAALLLLAGFAMQPVLAQDNGYVLGANDVISISVYSEEDLSLKEVRITDSGIITYPLLGEIKAAGSTIIGLETLLRRSLVDGEFMIDPKVTVTMVTYRPFYIDGEVAKPGSYPYEPGLTLRKAVSIAGGFTERASRSNITIHSAEREDADSRQTGSLDEVIQPGDVITIAQRFF